MRQEMHMPRRALDDDEIAALRVLRTTAVEGKGWKRGKVRGWMLASEINEGADSSIASYHLRRLREAGGVLGEHVRDPGRPRQPLVIWRITQGGEDELARVEVRDPVRIARPRPDPGDAGVIYTSRDAWSCLSVLQSHPGPVRWADIVEKVHRRFRAWVYPDDMKMLLTRGLAVRTDEGSGKKKVVWLHATPVGRAVRLVDGKTNTDIAQLRIPQEPLVSTEASVGTR
jgi:DNA-binding transcriptional ArsR family regulator